MARRNTPLDLLQTPLGLLTAIGIALYVTGKWQERRRGA
jgi:hypothetical protein